ncbi:MAG: COQ9 family protein [Proteobacteria bacterium]|nr:COQ9 family protein [Pseudomonadota bacterium]
MNHLKDAIALAALDDAPFDGWTMAALGRAAQNLGKPALMAEALFPEGIADATRHVTDIFDRRLMAELKGIKTQDLRVRERIALAVMTRFQIMTPYKPGLRVALAVWTNPFQAPRAAKTLWASADKIWVWAGDTATDYNHYTKRALLSGVMASGLLFWLQDQSPKGADTRAFLERRIDSVLALGRLVGRRKAA